MSNEWVFDIETDGFLHQCTKLWMVVLENIHTGEVLEFVNGDDGWKDVFNNATLLVGHNILGFDLPALTKLCGYRLPKRVKVRDTLLLSQILDYRRFGHDGHSLETWGRYLGYEKIDFDKFDEYSEEMLIYCRRDVSLNVRVYAELMEELAELAERSPKILTYLRAEQAAAKWSAAAELDGWPFDVQRGQALLGELTLELEKAYTAIESRLGLRVVAPDSSKGKYPYKEPKWVASGAYHSHTASWFGVNPWSGYPGEERMIEGPYTRVIFKPLSLDSVADVKLFLFRNGWVPTEYNTKRDPETGKLKRTSPKITEDSLELLGGDGKLYTEFLTAKSRFSILKGWLENVDEEGNLHGSLMLIGTPSMRARHSLIVNVPSGEAAYGRAMRELFTCPPGWKMVGCDSSGNQARGLAHYLKDPVFIDTLLNGDIHQYNADVLTKVLHEMGIEHTVPRSVAKRILYAFLFGASGAKLWSYVFGSAEPKKGNKLKNGFLQAVPGFASLIEKLNNIWGSTSKSGYGYIPSIAGNRIYVDSPHKLLVYLLQSCEKATCSAALMLTAER